MKLVQNYLKEDVILEECRMHTRGATTTTEGNDKKLVDSFNTEITLRNHGF